MELYGLAALQTLVMHDKLYCTQRRMPAFSRELHIAENATVDHELQTGKVH